MKGKQTDKPENGLKLARDKMNIYYHIFRNRPQGKHRKS